MNLSFDFNFSSFEGLPAFRETRVPPGGSFLGCRSLAVCQLPSLLGISWCHGARSLPSPVVPVLLQPPGSFSSSCSRCPLQPSRLPACCSPPLENTQSICKSREQGLFAQDLHTTALNTLHGRAKDFTHLALPFNFLLTSVVFSCRLKTFSKFCSLCSQLFWLFFLTRMLNLSTLQPA